MMPGHHQGVLGQHDADLGVCAQEYIDHAKLIADSTTDARAELVALPVGAVGAGVFASSLGEGSASPVLQGSVLQGSVVPAREKSGTLSK